MNKPRHYIALDSWRGIAALMIAVFHTHGYLHSHVIHKPPTQNLFLMVDFFFVLSGFIMAETYHGRLASRQVSVRRFLWLRLGRVWPLHMAILIGAFAFDGVHWNMSAANIGIFVIQFVLLQGIIPRTLVWNFPSWSISAEFYVYILFAFFALFVKRFQRTVLGLTIAFCLATILWRSSQGIDVTGWLGALRCAGEFSIGILLAWHMRDRPLSLTYAKATLWEVTAVVAIIVFFCLISPKEMLTLLAPLFFAGTIWIFAYDKGAISRILALRPFQVLGALSYSVYMLHAVLLELYLRMVDRKILGETPWEGDAYLAGLLAILLLCSYLTYHYFEWPMRHLFRKYAPGKKLTVSPQDTEQHPLI